MRLWKSSDQTFVSNTRQETTFPTAQTRGTPIFVGSGRTDRLGIIWAAASPHGLVAVAFGVSREQFVGSLHKRIGQEVEFSSRRLGIAIRQICEYVAGQRREFDLAIDWSAITSDFQRRTLRAVIAIPYGQTRTYAQIAAEIGQPNAPRAVGRANALNPAPLVIPCHRVIGSDGRLHGYGGAGGLATKAWLLSMESANA